MQIRIGVISSVHGIRGEAKVYPTTDDPQRFLKIKTVKAESTGMTRKMSTELEIESVRFASSLLIVKFKGIDAPEEMRKYRGFDLMIDRAEALPLSEGEYYASDLAGMEVVEENGVHIGTLIDIISAGAGSILTIENDEKKQMLMPFTDDFVKKIDIQNSKIVVNIMDGLEFT